MINSCHNRLHQTNDGAVVKFSRNWPERRSATCVWRSSGSTMPEIAVHHLKFKVEAPSTGDAVSSTLYFLVS